jgi:hypothetical protein
LNAILPREIADRLTRSTVQGAARATTADYSSDESSSDDLPAAAAAASRPRSEPSSAGLLNATSRHGGTDRGLQNLLTELHTLAPARTGHVEGEKKTKPVSVSIEMNPSNTVRNASETIHPPPRFSHSSRATNAAPIIPSHLEEPYAPNNAVEEENDTQQIHQEEGLQTEEYHQLPQFKRRKELERELRKGNLSFIEEQQEVHTLHQSISDFRTTDQLLSSSQMHHRASVPIFKGPKPSFQTYIPQEGTTVTQSDLTSKQRSKHQIHSLVASAVALQAKRNQEAGILHNNKGTSNARSDAKRKYGW